MQENKMQQEILHVLCGRHQMRVQLHMRGLSQLRPTRKDRGRAELYSRRGHQTAGHALKHGVLALRLQIF